MRLFASLIAALGLIASGASMAADRWFATQNAVIDIDATGAVSEVTLQQSGFSAVRQAQLIERIKQIQFDPATRDGVAHASRAHVSIELEVREIESGLVIALSGAQLTPQMLATKPPRYPAQMLRRGASGEVAVEIAYNAQGQVVSAKVVGSSSKSDEFAESALKAAKAWRVVPEQVGNVGVPGSAVIPVRFTIGTSGARQLKLDDGSRLQLFKSRPQHDGEMLTSSVGIRSLDAARTPI